MAASRTTTIISTLRRFNFLNAKAAGNRPGAFADRCGAAADYVCGDSVAAVKLGMIPKLRCVCGDCPRWTCSCGTCADAAKPDCAGKVVEPACPSPHQPVPYTVQQSVRCPLHAQEVRIACEAMAADATVIIDSQTGMGSSNGTETKNGVMKRFRGKDCAFELVHYAASTGAALLQGNQLAAASFGLRPWLIRVLEAAGLPTPPRMVEQVQAKLVEQAREHQRRRTAGARRKRVDFKRARGIDHEQRKLFDPAAGGVYLSETMEAEFEADVDSDAEGQTGASGERFGAAQERRDGIAAPALGAAPAVHEEGSLPSEPEPEAPTGGTTAASTAQPPGSFNGQLDDFVDIRGKTVLALPWDIETSGQGVYLDVLLQLAMEAHLVKVPAAPAAAAWELGPVVAPFASLVHTNERLTEFIRRLTRISQAEAEAAPVFAVVWVEFKKWIAGAVAAARAIDPDVVVVLIAQNGDGFDFPFMEEFCAAHGEDFGATLAELGVSAIGDTLKWSRKLVAWPVHPTGRNDKGDIVEKDDQTSIYAALFDGALFAAHRADADVRALVEILRSKLFSACLSECGARMFVSLVQSQARQGVLRAAWLQTHGGFGRAERALCRCGAVTRTDVTEGSGRRFLCQRAGRTERDGGPTGCVFRRFYVGPAYKPGFEPPPPKTKRAPVNNGKAGACTCSSACATAQCPCLAAKRDCGAGCSHEKGAAATGSRKRKPCACCNFPAGREAAKAQKQATRDVGRIAARAGVVAVVVVGGAAEEGGGGEGGGGQQ